MEVTPFDGYTVDDKVATARGYLCLRQVERNGLVADDVTIADAVLRLVVNDYTREAGVRQLERELGTLLRKTAAAVASATAAKPVVVDEQFVRQALGRAKVFH